MAVAVKLAKDEHIHNIILLTFCVQLCSHVRTRSCLTAQSTKTCRSKECERGVRERWFLVSRPLLQRASLIVPWLIYGAIMAIQELSGSIVGFGTGRSHLEAWEGFNLSSLVLHFG